MERLDSAGEAEKKTKQGVKEIERKPQINRYLVTYGDKKITCKDNAEGEGKKFKLTATMTSFSAPFAALLRVEPLDEEINPVKAVRK